MVTVVGGTARVSNEAADLMCHALMDAINNASSPKIDLLDEAGRTVKSLDPESVGTHGEISDGKSYWILQIHIYDDSADEYTFKSVKVRGVKMGNEFVMLYFTLDNPISKASSDVLDLYLKYRFVDTFSG